MVKLGLFAGDLVRKEEGIFGAIPDEVGLEEDRRPVVELGVDLVGVDGVVGVPEVLHLQVDGLESVDILVVAEVEAVGFGWGFYGLEAGFQTGFCDLLGEMRRGREKRGPFAFARNTSIW